MVVNIISKKPNFYQAKIDVALSYINDSQLQDAAKMKNGTVVFVIGLIKEHAVYKNGCLSLHVSDLPIYIQKTYLHVFLSASELEAAYEAGLTDDDLLVEESRGLQRLIDENIDDVFHDAMYEKGKHFVRVENGEIEMRDIGK